MEDFKEFRNIIVSGHCKISIRALLNVFYFRFPLIVRSFCRKTKTKKSLVRQCEYKTQPKGSFWCHIIDAKGAVFY